MENKLDIIERRKIRERLNIIAKQLFTELNIPHYTRRHLMIVAAHLYKDSKDAKQLLSQLGLYNNEDLEITTKFLENYERTK